MVVEIRDWCQNVGEYNTYNFCIWHFGLCVIVSKIDRCRSPRLTMSQPTWCCGGRGLPSLIALFFLYMCWRTTRKLNARWRTTRKLNPCWRTTRKLNARWRTTRKLNPCWRTTRKLSACWLVILNKNTFIWWIFIRNSYVFSHTLLCDRAITKAYSDRTSCTYMYVWIKRKCTSNDLQVNAIQDITIAFSDQYM